MHSLSLHSTHAFIASVCALGTIAGCASAVTDDADSTTAALDSHATDANIQEWSAEAAGILAVANDRSLGVEDYVFRVRISRVTAEAIVAVRNGTNGTSESRPNWMYPSPPSPPSTPPSSGGGPVPSAPPAPVPPMCWGGSGETPSPSASGSQAVPVPPPMPMPTPAPYPCHPSWELGGDDEMFSRLHELDALPGTDVAAWQNLRAFAGLYGYTSAGPYPSPVPVPPGR